MAYMNQERKATLAPAIKSVLKEYGFKGSIAVQHHSTLVVNVRQGTMAIPEGKGRDGHIDVNTYWIDDNYEDHPKWKAFLKALHIAMMTGNHDRSDIQTDYFDVGWYTTIHIGRWNKPYQQI